MWPFLQTTSNTCGCEQSSYNQCGCNKTSSNDISYNGPALVCTEINLCDSLTVALQKIEAKICSTGNISGSGTNNYIPKWTPNGTTLGNSQMRDDGVTVGIGTFYGSPIFKFSITSNLPNTFINNTINTTTSYFALSAGVSDNTNVPKNNYTGTGIFGYADSSTTQNIGVRGRGQGINAILNIGVNGNGIASLNNPCITSLGGKFEAGFGTNNYAVQLIDGTEAVGKFLKSITANGHANWANITASDVSGVVAGSGTNNYISKWTPNSSTLGNSQIQDNGDSISINSSLNPDRRLSVVTSVGTPQTAVYGETVTSGYIGVVGSNIGVGPGSNIGVYGVAQGNTDYNYGVSGSGASTSTATGIGITGDAYGTGVSIGIRANAISGSQKYAAQLMDGTEGIGKVLTCVGSQGKANWVTPTTGVAGSGTTNYVARWTPNGTTLGIGSIRDDNTSVGINQVPDPTNRLSVAGGSLRGFYASTSRISTPSDVAAGTWSISSGTGSSGENVGVLGIAENNTNVNYGVYGGSTAPTTGKNIGLRGVASSGAAGNYAIQLQDGTQAAGKFLKSITNNGEANWANITSSDTTGATGTFTSQDGKTITVTNGLITSIV